MTMAEPEQQEQEAAAAEEAAFLAERERLRGLLQRQQRAGAGAEAGGDGDGDGEGQGLEEEEGEEGVRYVRVKPCADPGEEAEQLHALLRTEAGAEPLPWCPPHDPLRVWALPAGFRLAQWAPYRAGRVYGMDAASAAAVWALAPQPGEHVLDLCCAPGLKLSAVADALGGCGSITGVDVSRARLAVARKVAVKYKVGRPTATVPGAAAPLGGGGGGGGGGSSSVHAEDAASAPPPPPPQPLSPPLTCRLLCADGVRFALGPLAPWNGAEENVVFDSRAYDWQGMEARGQRRMNRGTRRKELLALRALLLSPPPPPPAEESAAAAAATAVDGASPPCGDRLYDRVLVDSDCTHDGSARHLAKVAGLEERVQTRAGGFLSREKLAGLEALQRGLICNGFRLLRPGGVLVYSTCSLSARQNEAVVRHLLAAHPDTACLDPITELGRPRHGQGQGEEEHQEEGEGKRWLPCRWGDLPGTLLFEPRFGTSGLFVARVRKQRRLGGEAAAGE